MISVSGRMRRYVLRLACTLLALVVSSLPAGAAAPHPTCTAETHREHSATRHAHWVAVAATLRARLFVEEGAPEAPGDEETARALVCKSCDAGARAWVASLDRGAHDGFGTGVSALVVRGDDGGLWVYDPIVFVQLGRCSINDGGITIHAGASRGDRGAIVADISRSDGVMLEDEGLGTFCMTSSETRDLLVVDPRRPAHGFAVTVERRLAEPNVMPELPKFVTLRADGSIVYDRCGRSRVAPVALAR